MFVPFSTKIRQKAIAGNILPNNFTEIRRRPF